MATELQRSGKISVNRWDNLPNLRGSTARWDQITPCFISIPAHYLWVKIAEILGVSKGNVSLNPD